MTDILTPAEQATIKRYLVIHNRLNKSDTQRLLAHIDTLTGLLEEALDFAHSDGCSGGITIRMEPNVDVRVYKVPCKPSCEKAAFDETVRRILRRKETTHDDTE